MLIAVYPRLESSRLCLQAQGGGRRSILFDEDDLLFGDRPAAPANPAKAVGMYCSVLFSFIALCIEWFRLVSIAHER